MTGLPDFNRTAFFEAAEQLSRQNLIPLNPATVLNGETHHPREAYMREDISLLLDADAIFLLPGWQASRGARVEMIVAQELGLRFLNETTPMPPSF